MRQFYYELPNLTIEFNWNHKTGIITNKIGLKICTSTKFDNYHDAKIVILFELEVRNGLKIQTERHLKYKTKVNTLLPAVGGYEQIHELKDSTF